ncbi:UDP-glucose/GDP-mannose dehydrogenase family protein, partial [bacterium]|nr:UDP-glucose/GDP-mannose dehydrogenase family protein [bacterium]
ESAELVKYASNSFLATKISFANEIATLAEKIPGVDVDEVMRGVGLDHRISPHYFGAGPGFGGSCFPKDLRALIHFARECGIEPILLESVLERNIRQARHIVDVAKQILGGFDGRRITILGLSFKPNTADMREAPSLRIIEEFRRRGAKDIIAYDPVAIAETKKIIGDLVEYAFSVKQALSGSDLAVIVTEWDEFVNLSPEIFVENMRTPVVIDTRRIYDPEKFGEKLRYFAVGRGEV